jgi:hypothetical protein
MDLRTGDHNESGNGRNLQAVGLPGKFFNQGTCFGCHIEGPHVRMGRGSVQGAGRRHEAPGSGLWAQAL